MRANVLVADGELTTLELVAAVLTREGFVVHATCDGGDALARFFEVTPAVVVCAQALPVLTGAKLAKQIKAERPQTRVVVLLGGAALDQEAAALAEASGCDAVHAGPFRYDVLKALLTEWGFLTESLSPPEPPLSFGVPVVDALSLLAPPAGLEALLPAAMELVPAVEELASAAAQPVAVPGFGAPIPLPIPVPALEVSPEPELAAEPLADGAPLAELDLDALALPDPADLLASPEPSPAAPVAASPEPSPLAPAAALPEPPPAVPAAVLPELSLDELLTAEEPPSPVEQAPSIAPKPEPASPATSRPGRATVPVGLAPRGELEQMPVPRLLFELYVGTFSGALHLTRQGVERVVYLWGGLPVRVEAADQSLHLARVLLEHGRITSEQHQAVEAHMRQTGQKAGRTLIELGILDEAAVLDGVRHLTEVRLASTFAWREGRYRIEGSTAFADDTLFGEVHPLKVIFRGISEHYDLLSLLAYFHPLRARYAVATELLRVHFDTVGPYLKGLPITTVLDGKTTIERALRSDDQRALQVAQALYVLLVTDMIRAQAQPGAPAVAPAPLVSAAVTKPVDYRELTRVCDQVARVYLRLKDNDLLAALGVSVDATAAEIQAAYEKEVAPFRPEVLLPGLPEDVLRRAREITEILARARTTLLDPAARARHLEGRARPSSPPPDAPGSPPASQRSPAAIAYAVGLAFMNQKEFKKAQRKLEEAVKLDAQQADYWVALARSILGDDSVPPDVRRHGALNCLRQALGLEATHVEANVDTGAVLLALGQKAAAKTHLQQAVKRAPEHARARKLLAQLG